MEVHQSRGVQQPEEIRRHSEEDGTAFQQAAGRVCPAAENQQELRRQVGQFARIQVAGKRLAGAFQEGLAEGETACLASEAGCHGHQEEESGMGLGHSALRRAAG